MKRIGKLLVDLGWITEQDLQRALISQRALGGSLGTCLLEHDALSEERLMRALAHQAELPAARPWDLTNVPQVVRDLLPAKVARRHKAVPFRMIGNELYVAMVNPESLEARDQIAFVTGKELRPHVGNEVRILVALDRYYDAPSDERYLQLEARLDYLNERISDRPGPRESTESVTVSDLSRRLAVVDHPGALAQEMLSYLAPKFRRVALFQALSHGVRGWRGVGLVSAKELPQYRQGFHEPSIFLELKAGKRCHVGPLSRVPAHRRLERALGEPPVEHCFVMPIHVGRRLAAVILCEHAKHTRPGTDATEVERIASAAGEVLARCIRNTKSSTSSLSPRPSPAADAARVDEPSAT
ncbi:MAG: hypothetical protein DWQ36_23300 [Acidobacteria bacterium]|nr:MAG: hypothetical protein DWQ36_23300 [Acidobacteriota bacterium]